MKLIVIFLIGILVLSGCLQNQTTQWEYMVADTIESPIEIDELGSNGWELVSIVTIQTEPGIQHYILYFKREKQEIEKP